MIQISEQPSDIDPNANSIDVGSTAEPTVPSVEDAQKRAYRFSVGFPQLGQEPDMFRKVMEGKESELRDQATAIINVENELKRRQIIEAIARKAGPLTREESDQINRTIDIRGSADPYSVFEEYYSMEYLNGIKRAADINPDSFINDARRQNPDVFDTDFSRTQGLYAKKEVALSLDQMAKAAYKQQSYLGYGVDIAKSVVTLGAYDEAKTRGVAGNYLAGFRGTNLDINVAQLYQLPLAEFTAKATELTKKYINDNPSLAVTFTNALVGQTAGELALANIFGAIDVIGLGAVAKGATSSLKLMGWTRNAMKQAVRQGTEVTSKEGAEEAVGNVREVAIHRATGEVLGNMDGKGVPAGSAVNDLYDMYTKAADDVVRDPGNISKGFTLQLRDRILQYRDTLFTTIEDMIRVDRLAPVVAVERAIRKAAEEIGAERGLNNHIMNIKIRVEPLTNTYFADFYLGDTAAKTFGTEKTGLAFLKKNSLVGEVSEETQKGIGFTARVSVPIKENAHIIRDAIAFTAESKTPDSWLSAVSGVVGSARTPDETLSLMQRLNRKASTYGPSVLSKVMWERAEEIRKFKGWSLPGTKKKERGQLFDRIVDSSFSLNKDGSRKFFFDTPGEFSAYWRGVAQREPDEQEIAAYFALKDQHLTRYVIDNITAYRNKARLGTESHTITAIDAARAMKNSAPVKKVTIDGVRQKEFPTGGDTVLIVEDNGNIVLKSTGEIRGKWGDELKKSVKDGITKVIKVTNAEDRIIRELYKDVGDSRPKWILAKQVESKPMSWKQIQERVPETDYEHYVAQGILKKDPISNLTWYEGDRTLAGFQIRAMAKDVAEKIDHMRQLFKEKKYDEAKAYLVANPLDRGYDEIYGWFHGKKGLPIRGPDGKFTKGEQISPKLSLDDKINVVPRHKLTKDVDKAPAERLGDAYRDGTSEGYGRFLTGKSDPHDIFTLRNEGTKSNPLYKTDPVKYLDPITAINRALTRSINGLYMDDYKIFSVESWIKEAESLLKANKEDLWESPFHHFFSPQWLGAADTKKVNNLMAARFQIRQFLGVENAHERFLKRAEQALQDSIYGRLGPNKAQLASWIVPVTRDPIDFIRGVTFHAKIGLFSIPQLFVQAQTFANIWGIAGPRFAAQGTAGALLHAYGRLNRNPEILNKLDSIAQKIGYKPGEWLEMNRLGNSSGFFHVGREYALRDSPLTYDILTTPLGDILNWGTSFFRGGEKATRYGAWYTAFGEFRAANPTGRITQGNLKTILERADTLYGNMSRASSSTLHQGVFSIPTQFLAYQMRIAELFWGKRLTQMERARLMATYSVLYGVPGMYGLSGLPLQDYIRKWAIDDGYVVGDQWWNSLITEGAPSMLMALATGNWYNVQERYSVQGFEILREAMRSDKTWWNIFGGAAFSTFSNTYKNVDGFANMILSGIRGDGMLKPKVEDIIDAFKEISSVSNTNRFITALNTGKWFSKNEQELVKGISPMNALFMYITGLQPQTMTDMQAQSWTRRDEKANQQEGLKAFIREFRRGLYAQEKEPTQGRDYFIRAFARLSAVGYPEEKVAEAISLALKDHENLAGRINWDYYLKDVPEYRKPAARAALQKAVQNNRF